MAPGFRSWEDPFAYDLVTDTGSGNLLLFEMKSLEWDEATQTRRAIGQLLFYEGVVLPRGLAGPRRRPNRRV